MPGRTNRAVALGCVCFVVFCARPALAVPALPEADGVVHIAVQEWPLKPGPRSVRVLIHYPQGALKHVGPKTGIMLSLHNWGGTGSVGTADPVQLATRYNVVAICLDYLQSGPEPLKAPEPYDYGYLQALDALRALQFVYAGLEQKKLPFATGRIYATGGSGGGNVSLMVNKLAPRTFACIVDLCGMAKLNDDIAFGLPGGSELNAGYRREADHPYHLSPAAQELRFVGNPAHLKTMRQLGNCAKVIVVHGVDDDVCPVADARELVANFQSAELDVVPNFITKDEIDGQAFVSTGHSLGNRTKIVFQVADRFLLPDVPQAAVRKGVCDFECREAPVEYRVTGGKFVISYAAGAPVGTFVPDP